MSSRNSCPFCEMVNHELNPVVVHEDKEILAIMDLYPATPGHILVLPKQHIEDIYAMSADMGARIMVTAIAVAKAIRQQLHPSGLKQGVENGFN